jgi:hypothetical protein
VYTHHTQSLRKLFFVSYEFLLTQKVRKVTKDDVQRSADQRAILARVEGQGALLARREEVGA